MLKYLKDLCLMDGVSSFEDNVRDYIVNIASKYADDMRIDAMGNLIVFKKGKKSVEGGLMLAAHMDEVGFMVKKIEDDGYLRFVPVGGIDPRVVMGRRVFVGDGMVPGVLGLKAYHLVSREEEKKVPAFTQMYIDIAAPDKDAAMKKVKLGDKIVFDSDFVEFGENMIKAKAIDDRAGCAIMLNLLTQELPCDVTFAFTVQEEVGYRGAFAASFSVHPAYALVLEGTTCVDISTVPAEKKVCQLRKGPVIGCMDGSTIYDKALFDMTTALADEAGIPWQIKRFISGGTDASVIQRSREGVRVANISVPVRYLHSPSTVAYKKDIDNAYKLAQLFIEAVAEGKAGK